MDASFHITIENATLSVRLDNPAQHNKLTPATMAALREALEEKAVDTSLRVMVLTGTGKSFCAGADLGELGRYNFDENPLEKLTDVVERLPFPTICALNGGVYGGGADLALSCDFRIGITTMRAFIPPARIGIHYPPAGLARAVARLGLGPAKRLFLTVERMSAEELKAIGFLDYLVAPEELEARTNALAADIAALAPLSLRGMKETLNDIARGELDIAKARRFQMQCLQSDDFKEGKAALAEKRPARFNGA
ncbi:MAG: 3-hydroxybutyryl-CoA dehydratase [Sneathiella sp.]|uniref:enoyl-CoA hydratase/isomerase family protein n=1 Tax=Sneathiella sp. TaxID=1964365 RepID=UPI000C672828|nr:enoyl-CoA hydratase/isomerase family protein [Sneathiella sp.]MAL79347.1 3-hydroxybutyryl-CoA dehydratase [Sneathiella sp.]|tara:strand:- start:221 stop:976 length:756 start_codon:yes stop_codon:yes gene_type:complete